MKLEVTDAGAAQKLYSRWPPQPWNPKILPTELEPMTLAWGEDRMCPYNKRVAYLFGQTLANLDAVKEDEQLKAFGAQDFSGAFLTHAKTLYLQYKKKERDELKATEAAAARRKHTVGSQTPATLALTNFSYFPLALLI